MPAPLLERALLVISVAAFAVSHISSYRKSDEIPPFLTASSLFPLHTDLQDVHGMGLQGNGQFPAGSGLPLPFLYFYIGMGKIVETILGRAVHRLSLIHISLPKPYLAEDRNRTAVPGTPVP